MPSTQTALTGSATRQAGHMTDGEDANARDDTPDSATAIAEMRPLVGSFGDVEPADMDERPVSLEDEGRAEQFWRLCENAAVELLREGVDYRHREQVCYDDGAYLAATSAEPAAYVRTVRTWLVDQWACTYTSSNVRPSVRDGSIEHFDRQYGPGMRSALEQHFRWGAAYSTPPRAGADCGRELALIPDAESRAARDNVGRDGKPLGPPRQSRPVAGSLRRHAPDRRRRASDARPRPGAHTGRADATRRLRPACLRPERTP